MSKSKTKDARRPYWLSAPCPDWCRGRHEDYDAVEDRMHLSRWENRTVVSLYSAAHGYYPDYPGGPDHEYCEPVELMVSVEQGIRESAPRVQVYSEGKDGPGSMNLTIDEALKLAKALTTAVDIAEGHATGRGDLSAS